MIDIDGKDIKIGARVAFGVRLGNRAGLAMGTVQSITTNSSATADYAGIHTDGKRFTHKPGSELAVVLS